MAVLYLSEMKLNNHRLKTEGLNSSTKSTDTGHFRPV